VQIQLHDLIADILLCRAPVYAKETVLVFAAPRLQLTLTSPRNNSHHRISSNERKKQLENSGKGQNELLEIVNPSVQRESQLTLFNATRLKIVVRGESRAARGSVRELGDNSITATNAIQKPTFSQVYFSLFSTDRVEV
jgi:hypothetical protein